ncbi:MAG TPA: hypothetical protein VNB03_12030, partial [Casimicrobiaceae bacterium]|nr:hypothetical protein [Casimicrobiaceae bacterium]
IALGLARTGTETIGWLHAAPRGRDHEADDHRGVAAALLDGALADLAARGLAVVDAFPFKAGDSTAPADHYHGPASLFASRGFSTIAETADLAVMRKHLVAGAAPADAAT